MNLHIIDDIHRDIYIYIYIYIYKLAYRTLKINKKMLVLHRINPDIKIKLKMKKGRRKI